MGLRCGGALMIPKIANDEEFTRRLAGLSGLAHRAEKWTRFSAPYDALFQGGSIGSIPKVESTFGSDALDMNLDQGRSGKHPVPSPAGPGGNRLQGEADQGDLSHATWPMGYRFSLLRR